MPDLRGRITSLIQLVVAHRAQPEAKGRIQRPALIGNSAAIATVRLALAQMAVRPRASVLILGERGTGKQRCSAILHENTYPRGQSFELSQLRQLPELESRLCALRAIRAEQPGLGLTIRVPELASADEDIQRCVARLLADQRLPVRLIACSLGARPEATSVERRRLEPACRFAFALRLPPLRDRLEDIAPLARHFAERVARASLTVRFSPAEIAQMRRYSWPGNLSELQAFVAAQSVEEAPTVREAARLSV
jgi:DNA-binding NtrC family response regulator